MKVCPKCQLLKHASNFGTRNRTLVSGNIKVYLRSYCSVCDVNVVKKYNQTKVGYLKKLLGSAKSRAKKNNLPFNVSFESLLPTALDKCPILNTPLVYSIGVGGLTEKSPSIDRIDSSKGYIDGNVQIISHRANTLKSNATKEELIALGKWASNLGCNNG